VGATYSAAVSLVATAVVTALGAGCAAGTLWLAHRAEQAEQPPPEPPAGEAEPAPPWWESEPWWPALSEEERGWVVRNLADAGHAPGAEPD